MHIDLNSCFATVEQQARPLLRGKPVAIANRRTEHTAIVTASYEAKSKGITVGMKVKEALRLAPDLVVLESDPPKYRFVYHKLLAIMQEYSAHVAMKSIDEGVIDFRHATSDMRERSLLEIGQEIKQRLYADIGVAMTCNIGISTNRFLAKTAAGMNKPNGLTCLTHENIRTAFAAMKLTDLTGIAYRYERRLNSVGIYTPLDFLGSSKQTLSKMVFKSIEGDRWFYRLRGWEVDDRSFDVKRVGRQYVLERFDLSREEIERRLHHLCESIGARLRRQDKVARGIYVYAKTLSRTYWHRTYVTPLPFFSDAAIVAIAKQLFFSAPADIREIGAHAYLLSNDIDRQLSLFGDEIAKERAVTGVMDEINIRYGERTIVSANTVASNMYVKEKIPFGSTRYL